MATPDQELAIELYDVLLAADSLLSLVAYRYPTGIPEDVVDGMKAISRRARLLYETMPTAPEVPF